MKGFKNFFKTRTAVNASNIHETTNFMDLESCRHFLNNLYIDKARVEFIELANGARVRMENIPEDQIIQRAQELRSWIIGAKVEK